MSYQPGIPTGTVNLDVDYKNIQDNFTQLDTQFGVDHIPFSNNSGTPPTGVNGYHQSIHFNPASTLVTNPPNNYPAATPTTTPGFGQLFSCQVNDRLNTDQALYYKTGGNKTIQLTRNIQPVSASAGITFLPGGILIQWGQVNSGSAGDTGTVTFPTAFPTACYSVWTQIAYTSGSAPQSNGVGNVAIDRSFSGTSFRWFIATPSDKYSRFYWVAIGA